MLGGWIKRYDALATIPRRGGAFCKRRAPPARRFVSHLCSRHTPSHAAPPQFSAQENTPLHVALFNGKTDAAKRLVYHGADLNAENEARPNRKRPAPREALPALRACAAVPGPPTTSLCTHLTQPLFPARARQAGYTPINYAWRRGLTELTVWLEQAQLKKARARRHWASARTFVQVYPYALFWHAYVGKQLCAPGGKWAERDRAAFEEEFGELRSL